MLAALLEPSVSRSNARGVTYLNKPDSLQFVTESHKSNDKNATVAGINDWLFPFPADKNATVTGINDWLFPFPADPSHAAYVYPSITKDDNKRAISGMALGTDVWMFRPTTTTSDSKHVTEETLSPLTLSQGGVPILGVTNSKGELTVVDRRGQLWQCYDATESGVDQSPKNIVAANFRGALMCLDDINAQHVKRDASPPWPFQFASIKRVLVDAGRDLDDAIGRSLRSEEVTLKVGELRFNLPGIMRVNEPQDMEAIVSRDLKQRIQSSLLGGGLTRTARLQISNDMTASLLADSDEFKITPLADAEKTFAPDGTIHWVWHISPQKPGPKEEISLVISVILHDQMGTGHNFDAIRSVYHIEVQTLPPLEQGLQFTKDNWQWLWAFIFVPYLPSLLMKIRALVSRRKPLIYDDLL